MDSRLQYAAKRISAKTNKTCTVREEFAVQGTATLWTYVLIYYQGTALYARYFKTIEEFLAFARTLY